MNNIVEVRGRDLAWLSEVLQRAVENEQSVFLHVETYGDGPALKVKRAQSMWSAPVKSRS